MKIWLKRLLGLASVAAVGGAFFGLPTALACRIQPAPTVAFLVVLLLTPLWGRFFCECLCPLGVLQSAANRLFHPKTAVRRVCTRLPVSRAQLAFRHAVLAVFAVLAACGFGAVAWFLTPYSIFGKALTLFWPGVALFAAIIVLAAAGKGRTWCNWICPAGTLFSLLAKKPLCEHKVGKGCSNCRACFTKPASGKTGDAGNAGKAGDSGVTRRATLKGVAVLAAADLAEKTTDGGFAAVSLPGKPERETPVLPPGALPRSLFDVKCVGCGLCIAACPSGCLSASTRLKNFGQPEMSFQTGYCRLACPQKCAEACPAEALKAVPAERKNVHMGHAVWEPDACIRKTDGVECTACSRKCPVKAIHVAGGVLVVDVDACVGCGACEHVCPARPAPAIRVEGLERQRIVVPMSEGDLVAEMKKLVEDGVACVAAKDGTIRAKESGRGVLPVLRLSKKFPLAGAIVVDKVVGRAAAAVCIAGGARRVHALLMSAEAAAMLKAAGVEASAEKTVPRILNRDMTDGCPMDAMLEGMDDPAAMAKTLEERLM